MTLGTAVFAQVSAPSLRPGALNTVSLNPAVLQWKKSAITVGRFESTNEIFNAAGVKTRTINQDGPFFQGVLTGENISVGVEKLSLEGTTSNPSLNHLIDTDQNRASLAGQFGGVVALGVGVENSKLVFSNARQQVNEIVIAGISLRLAEVFYLGFARGDETERREFGVGPREATRSLTRMGVGYLWQGEENAFRVSISREERETYNFDLGSGVFQARGEVEDKTWGLSGIFSNILVGVIFRKNIQRNEFNSSKREDERRAYHLGWVPLEGLAIVLRSEEREVTNLPTGVTQDLTLSRVTVTWQF